MSVSVTFLGTGGSVPSKYRALPSVLIRRGPELLLFDCGEGTQRQFLQAKAGTNRKMRIFISHLHGDHLFGLPGMLHSLAFMGRTQELQIYGPRGIADFVSSVNRVVRFYSQYPLKVKEVRAGCIVNDKEYRVAAAQAKHGIPCFAYAFEEKPRPGKFNPAMAKKLEIPEGPLWKKLQTSPYVRVGSRRIPSHLVVGAPRQGVKITYSVDTRPCSAVVKLARGSDLLIHDSSFDRSAAQKAVDYGHSTSTEAAEVAVRCKARKLALFHISAMYEDANPLLIQARKTFRNTLLSQDMMTIYVSRNR
jgi:ribonuclease Z